MAPKQLIERNFIINTLVLFLCIVFTWPQHGPDASPGLDGSYFTMLNFWAAHDFQQLQHMQFTFGPLGFLKNYYAYGDNIIWGVICTVFLKLGFFIAWARLEETKNIKAAHWLLILLVFTYFRFDFYFYLITFLLAWQNLTAPNKYHQVGIAFIITLGFLIKVNIGINSSLLLIPFLIIHGYRKEWKSILFIVASGIIFYFSIWLIMFQSLSGSINLILGYLAFIGTNSNTVLFVNNSHILIAIMFLAIIVLAVFQNESKRPILPFLALFLFVEFKYAFNRQEGGHIMEWMACLVFLAFTYVILSPRMKTVGILMILIMISSLTLNLGMDENFNSQRLKKQWIGTGNFNDEVLNYTEFKSRYVKKTQDNFGSIWLSDELLDIVDTHSVDFYPYELSYAAKYRLNYSPRAGLQTFGMPAFQVNQNAEQLNQGLGPEYIIWRAQNWKGQIGSIDNQYLFNNDGNYFMALFQNYSSVHFDRDVILLRNRPLPKITTVDTIIKQHAWGEKIPVPNIPSKGFLRARVELKSGFKRSIKNTLYKTRLPQVTYYLKDGREISYDFSHSDARMGLWISPFILQVHPQMQTSEVQSIKLNYSHEDPAFENDITVEWFIYESNENMLFGGL